MVEKYADIEKVVNGYIEELEKNGIHPQRVILYGSYAKGTATPDSDIDLVIISKDMARWPALERLELLSRLTAKIDAPLEVLGYTPDEIARFGADSILWNEIKRNSKTLKAA